MFTTQFSRSNLIESTHKIKLLISNVNNEAVLSSGNDQDYIYPRSSIKIFQAIPFINSKCDEYYNLNTKTIALACSSHRGESYHIKELESWIKKININKKYLKCGVHKPLNINANENLSRSNSSANELHNNCAGKHLAMITSCLVNNYNIKNYLNFDHPHQVKIRTVFEKFIKKKISKNNYGIDGCSAPQYSFKIKDISRMLNNLIQSYNDKFEYSEDVKKLIRAVQQNPKYIGGSDSLDSRIMSISGNNIFCKGGAEGVFLFIDLKKKLSGVIKIVDGNERAIPYFIYSIFKKYKIMNINELKKLNKFYNFSIVNHANIKVGKIVTKL